MMGQMVEEPLLRLRTPDVARPPSHLWGRVPYRGEATVNFVSKKKYNENYFTVTRPVHALMVA